MGTDKIYINHFPSFHLEKHRHQLIIEVELPNDAKKSYVDAKTAEPSATFVLETADGSDVALGPLVAEKQSFKANIKKRLADNKE